MLLLTASIAELFYDLSKYYLLIDFFDVFVVAVFVVDLYYRWKDLPHFGPYIRKHWLDILATIPFNIIFMGADYLQFTRALRGVRLIARYSRVLRITRIATRGTRFLRMRHHVKETHIREVQPHEEQMKGVLSFKVILLVTINSIMGTGIWFLTAAGAKHAGPASLISWGILSLVAVYIAMCFSELTAMFPKAGGVYEFAKQTYGRFWSFIIGWTTSIAGSVTISMLLLGALQYMIPIKYAGYYIPLAFGLIVLFNYIAYRGMQTSTYMLVAFALITIATIVAIIVPGFFSFDSSNFTPFFVFPAINIMLAIFFIAETFFGWESAIFLSAETKNPKKIMPKALIYGTMVIAAFSLLLALTAMGAINWQQYAQSVAPLRDLGARYFGTAGIAIFTILVSTSIIGAVASWIVTAPRLLMALAEDKLFFVHFAKIHPKHKSPYVSIVFQVLVLCVLVWIGSGSYETLLHLLIPLILLLYSAVMLSVVILRYKRPDLPRPFRTPFGKVGPFITIAFMAFMMYMYIRETHGAIALLKVSMSLIAFGVPAYFAIEIFYEHRYVTMRKNARAWLAHVWHMAPFPRPLFGKIIRLVGPLEKTTVLLSYDCGVGGFTREIIRRQLPFRKIYAVDKAEEQIKIFKANIPESKRQKVSIYHRDSWMIPKRITGVDAFVSFGSLGYIGDVPAFLKHMKSVMTKGGRYCFYVKNTFINMTPNALFVEDRKAVEKMFSDAGLKDVQYLKRKHLFTEEIFVHGRR
ncbi:amino acid permease [Candidatus Woesearchaeota archaeon]|nr:amino acid permease [Candidatus Woesearchaeota archaeon]